MSYHLSLAQSDAGTEKMVGFSSGLQPAFFRTKTQNRAGHMKPVETAVDPMSRIAQPNCHLVKIALMQMSNLV